MQSRFQGSLQGGYGGIKGLVLLMVVTARIGVDIPWCDNHSGALLDGVLSFGRSGCLLLALCACNA
jgi:hypothetical protein